MNDDLLAAADEMAYTVWMLLALYAQVPNAAPLHDGGAQRLAKALAAYKAARNDR